MTASVGQGDRIADVQVDPDLSLYEAEKTRRLAFFLNRLSGPASGGNSILVTPRIQYYLYLAPLYNSDRISSETLTKWFRMVDEREKVVRRELSRLAESDILPAANSLAVIEEPLRDAVARGAAISYQNLLGRLSASDRIWKSIIQHESPESWKQLINLSYVVAWLQQAKKFSLPGNLLLHVDDQIERVILSESGRLKRQCVATLRGIGPIVGLYLLQSLVEYSVSADSDLYARRSCKQADFDALQRIPSAGLARGSEWLREDMKAPAK